MYKKSTYITDPVGNNAFSFEKRNNKKLYIPNLNKINDLNEIKLGKKIVFEDYDFDGNMQSCTGLENFYEFSIFGKKVYLFDNHNHAFYFWYLARNKGLIGDDNLLYHIDEHSDMRDGGKYLLKPDSYDMQRVFNFTNFELNVGNYIIPAIKEGIIMEVIQIRNEKNLLDYINKSKISSQGLNKSNIILNLDLDFFQPDLDFIDYDLKKKVVLDIIKKAEVITVATSPFFIDQSLALKVFFDIFGTLDLAYN